MNKTKGCLIANFATVPLSAVEHMETEMARAFAAAEALQAIQAKLPDDLREIAARVVDVELAKQGITRDTKKEPQQ